MKRHVIITLDHRASVDGAERQWRVTSEFEIHWKRGTERTVYEFAHRSAIAEMTSWDPPLPANAMPVTLFYRAVKP